MRFKKEAHVSARLHETTKQKLYKSGYNAADAIEWFVHEWYSKNPKRRVAIQKDMLEIQLDNWKKVECEAQLEIEALEKQLEDMIGQIDIEVVEPVPYVGEVEDELPGPLREAIDRIKPVYLEKYDLLASPNVPDDEVLDAFITLNGDFVRNVYNEFGRGVKWKEFKEILLEELC